MAETVNAMDMLSQLEAQLENTKPSTGGGFEEIPAGLYQGMISGVSEPRTFERDGRAVPSFSFLIEILADSHQNQYVGRTYRLFQALDSGPKAKKNVNGDDEDLALYRGRVETFGLPNEVSTKLTKLQEILGPGSHVSQYRETYGPLPCVEFKLVAGERPNKKGKIPVFFNFVRKLDPEEAGEMDTIDSHVTVSVGDEVPF